MNFEKLLLVHLFRRKDLKALLSCSDSLFLKGVTKTLFRALKNYHRLHGRIPDIGVFKEAIKSKIPEDKVDIYLGLLDGLDEYSGEIPEGSELIKNLQDAFLVNMVDNSIEKLVEAAKNKDIANIKSLVSTIETSTKTTLKTPENMLNIDYTPSKIRIIDSCFESMRTHGLKLGGLTIVGGTSGGGKSIFTLQQLMYSYKEDKINTCLLNMELSETESIARMFSHNTGTPFGEVYGNTDPEMVRKVSNWKQKFFTSEAEFRMKSVRYSMSEIEATVRQQASEGVVLFGIDYLQIADFDVGNEEWKQLSQLVRMLHQLTQELQIVIISPVQINFSDTKIKDNELQITVRGSKELEFSSSVFLFIYQSPEEYKENVCRVFTVKARNSVKQIYLLGTDFKHVSFQDTGICI